MKKCEDRAPSGGAAVAAAARAAGAPAAAAVSDGGRGLEFSLELLVL